VFQLPAKWIDPAISRQAERQGCTVVDPHSVLLTHVGEVLQQYGHELLTREALKQMLEAVREFAPTVVDEIKSETVRMATIHQVLVQLAEERVSLSDLALVLESILNNAGVRPIRRPRGKFAGGGARAAARCPAAQVIAGRAARARTGRTGAADGHHLE
jgi:flagellar biosynthesis component FlhA